MFLSFHARAWGDCRIGLASPVSIVCSAAVHSPSWSPGNEKQSPYSTNTSRIFYLSVSINPSPILLSNSCSRSAFFSVTAVTATIGLSPSLISFTGSITPKIVPSSIHCLWSNKLVTPIYPIVPTLLTRVFPVDTLFVICNAWEGSTSAHPTNPFKSSGLVVTTFIDRVGTQHPCWITSSSASSVAYSTSAPMAMSPMKISGSAPIFIYVPRESRCHRSAPHLPPRRSSSRLTPTALPLFPVESPAVN
ncbi:hypothetical protein OUZ56_016305 [Daphnia magna]|uniref:Uncharacterized protein n=1 Tax=Daphnia magna TaxID=35525 RepID=A0ABR0AQ85_9CRUS|nr:hypothetical protein OUZ56_016305 [Daphnia magna]